MAIDLEQAYDRLYAYCKAEDFAGHDPFDGLNSRLFQFTPLKYFRSTRLAWLQLIKRSPINLRPALLVEKGVNPKGLALFALAELSRFRTTSDEEHAENAKQLLRRLLDAMITGETADGRSTVAFGYNFDWQSRVFFAPLGTPAIVPTAFASQAFVEAYKAFGDEKYIETAGAICEFVVGGLNRPLETDEEICFSYTPVDRSIIYNASLLAGECLARVGVITDNPNHLEFASKTVRFVIRRQRSDGSWGYGENVSQSWVDNFHTAYVLLSLKRISDAVPGLAAATNEGIEHGVRYWLDNFFVDDGTPKYYDNATYPVDIHSVAAAIVAMCELRDTDSRMLPLARKVAEWAIANLCDSTGFFYYQRRKHRLVKTPFMRWGQAWMAYALARLIEAEGAAEPQSPERRTTEKQSVATHRGA